ncbi:MULTISPECIES: GYD domain-containing protein [Alphaproteobacteria]|uniref:GYD domain-containing protein n=1 Tax=Alphaproteobacteria TaxID=28211 RepID=UPI0012BBD11B|nr:MULTISPECIES: GYD domain-containing protein [Alphaproteobacteria]MTI00720.1 GYD domain-containing protein [Roseibium sp. RKSG952]
MPIFITYASYSHAGVKGMLKKPENRTGPVKALLEKVGGRLISFYVTTGRNDVVVISEAPDGTDAVAVGMAVAASGAVSDVETVRAWTAEDFVAITEKAAELTGVYTPPGG